MDGQEGREWAISVSRLSDVRSACHLLLLNVSAHITSVSGIWYSENVRIITERIYSQYNKLQFVRPFAFAYAVTIGSLRLYMLTTQSSPFAHMLIVYQHESQHCPHCH
jgi:hypothetical protein